MEELRPGPLSGITVLDFTWVLAGPFATRTLADMGAYIIKVERYKDGTNERHLPLIVEHDGVTQSSYNINCNRGKKSICVNLKDPKGREIIHEFIKKCDDLNVLTIAFILPKSFKKDSYKRKIPKNYLLKKEIDLDDDSFTLNGNSYRVPCVFQIWERSTDERFI